MVNKIKFILLTLILIAGMQNILYSQCTMCKTAVEKATSNKENRAKGLNAGIIYLMVIPYIAVASIAYLWYRNSKYDYKEKEKILRKIRGVINS